MREAKRRAGVVLAGMLAAVLMAALGAGPAWAASENRALVIKDGVGFYCTDGYGNYTAYAIKVSTKAGTTSVSCHFRAGANDWTFWEPGERYSERGYNDCKTLNFYGEVAVMDSHFEITPNGAAVMTCN